MSMKPVVGVFRARSDAEQAAQQLRTIGMDAGSINVLTTEMTEKELAAIPTNQGEQPGMIKALGAVAGGALGLGLGDMVASLLLPGVGTVLGIGLAAGALLGALSGGAVGATVENSIFQELPEDDLLIYEDALRQGRTVVVATALSEAQAQTARAILARNGAESVDQARSMWWLGIRNIQKERYEAEGSVWDHDERDFRAGFEAALRPSNRSHSPEEVWVEVGRRYAELYNRAAFEKGFLRGRAYRNSLLNEEARAAKR